MTDTIQPRNTPLRSSRERLPLIAPARFGSSTWLLLLRWFAVAGQLLTILTAGSLSQVELPYSPLLGLVALTAITNTFYGIWLYTLNFLQADTLLFNGDNFIPIRQRMFDRGLIPWFVGIDDVNPQPAFFDVYNTAGFTSNTGSVRVIANESYDLNLYNAVGQLVRSENISSGRLNLSPDGLNAGVYILELVSDNHRKTIKLVKY